jgi:hypothetical protein
MFDDGRLFQGLFVVLVAAFILAPAITPRGRRVTSLLGALALMSIAVVQFFAWRRGFFYNDQSSQGAWVAIAYFGVGFVCWYAGGWWLMNGVLRFQPQGGFYRQSRQMNIVGRIILLAALFPVIERSNELRTVNPGLLSSAEEQTVHRVRDVSGAYPHVFSWRERDDAPAQRWAIPPGELADTIVQETVDGPRWIDLHIPAPAATRPVLRLHRDDSTADRDALSALRSDHHVDFETPYGLWIDERGGGFRLLGMGCPTDTVARHPSLAVSAPGPREIRCFEPASQVKRTIPGLFGLAHVFMYLPAAGPQAQCAASFRFRGRVVTVVSDDPCVSRAHRDAIAAATAMLDRFARAPR